jgi:hypothetical protein
MTTDNAPSGAPPPDSPPKRQPPWLGRRRAEFPRDRVLTLRLTTPDHTKFLSRAAAAGLSPSAFARRLITGTAGAPTFRIPTPEKRELARLLGLAGNIASNVNQMAHYCHLYRTTPPLAKLTSQQHLLGELVAVLKRALSRGYLTVLVKRLDQMSLTLERIAAGPRTPQQATEIAQITAQIAEIRQTILREIRHHT